MATVATAALTGGFQQALLVCGLIGLAGIPLAVILVRRAAGPRVVEADA